MCNLRSWNISDHRLCELLTFAVALCLVFFVVSKLVFLQVPNRECTQDAQWGGIHVYRRGVRLCPRLLPHFLPVRHSPRIRVAYIYHTLPGVRRVCVVCAVYAWQKGVPVYHVAPPASVIQYVLYNCPEYGHHVQNHFLLTLCVFRVHRLEQNRPAASEDRAHRVLPGACIPWFRVPQFRVPQFRVPRFRVPRFRVPRFRVPRFRVPRCRVPQCRVPRFRVPQCRVPRFRVPLFRVPPFRVPQCRVPQFRVSQFHVPHSYHPAHFPRIQTLHGAFYGRDSGTGGGKQCPFFLPVRLYRVVQRMGGVRGHPAFTEDGRQLLSTR